MKTNKRKKSIAAIIQAMLITNNLIFFLLVFAFFDIRQSTIALVIEIKQSTEQRMLKKLTYFPPNGKFISFDIASKSTLQSILQALDTFTTSSQVGFVIPNS